MARRYFTQEETDIASSTLTARQNRDYVDIDLTLATKPGPEGIPTTGDVYKKTGGEAVKQAMLTLLLTGPGEKPFEPNFGAGLYDMLFELNDIAEKELAIARIETNVQYFEPRADIEDIVIKANPDTNKVDIKVVFTIENISETVELTTSLNRLR